MTDKIVVFSTCASAEEGERIARALVERRLAACVNVLPGVRSFYRWKGRVEDASEVLVVMKTTRGLFDLLGAELAKLHSYEVPECIAVPVSGGLEPYLAWIAAETTPEEGR